MLKKNKKIIKLFGSLGLCLILLFSCILFPACSSVFDETGDEITFFEQYIDGFKVVYSNSLTGQPSSLKPLENAFFYDTLEGHSYGLAYYYGSADSTAISNPQWFPDSIRMLVIKDADGQAELVENNGANYNWNWSFSENSAEGINPKGLGLSYSEWKTLIFTMLLNYSTAFTNMYLLPLKVVMYEVLLGYDELTTFAPATGAQLQANGYSQENAELVAVVVKSGNASIKGKVFANAAGTATYYENKEEYDKAIEKGEQVEEIGYLASEELAAYINFLREEYLAKTKYLFFTKENADKMISYILDEVIGTELVEFDYKNYGPSSTNATYVDSIEGITKEQFMEILGFESADEQGFDVYVAGLKAGDVVYDKSGQYNYLVYVEKTTIDGQTVYNFNDYYNYRNYIERVGKIIYAQTYDGDSDEFVYSREIKLANNKIAEVKYDYVKESLQAGELADGLAKGDFTATPATFFTSFQGERFFEEVADTGEELEYTFGVAPKAEYQSIVMVTNPKNKFEIEAGIGFNILAYDRNLEVNIKVRFYHWDENAQIGRLYEFAVDPLDFSNSEEVYDPSPDVERVGYYNDFEVGFEVDKIQGASMGISDSGNEVFIIPHVTNTAFKNIGLDEKEINLGEAGNKLAAGFYKVENSKNGYGGITILDEDKMRCSFYEIVFDIVKSPEDPADMDYDFKVTVSPAIW